MGKTTEIYAIILIRQAKGQLTLWIFLFKYQQTNNSSLWLKYDLLLF